MTTPAITVTIFPNDGNSPTGKLADAEIHFNDGPLAGMRLLGFAIWERRNGPGRNVTYPARTYSVNGERRSFSLLRPIHDVTNNGLRAATDKLILDAYAEYDRAQAAAPITEAAARATTAAGNANRLDSL